MLNTKEQRRKTSCQRPANKKSSKETLLSYCNNKDPARLGSMYLFLIANINKGMSKTRVSITYKSNPGLC